ncbi:mariner transposase [Trichonephila clavipes]|uniref:Mariner transposase n=1 Tax=Trichonephila clavipes TaxID=2585209 RepID=A0A8X7BMG2_TRICX|nr:mariner transposase [Trichonephila clavipes]
MDEIWVHHFISETKEQSKQWTEKGEPAPKTIPSAVKIRASIFGDALEQRNRAKTAALIRRKCCIIKTNEPAHRSIIAMAKINELNFELLPHAPYSPDLATSDYFLFPNLKKWPSEQKLSNDEEGMLTVNGYYEEQDSSYYKKGIEHRWEKCRAERRLC